MGTLKPTIPGSVFRLTAAIVLVSLLGQAPALGEPTDEATLRDRKAFLIAAIVSEREKLNSAEFTIEGVQLDPKWKSPGKISIHGLVDIPKSMARWDERTSISIEPHPEIPRVVHGIFLTVPGSAMYWLSPPLGLHQIILVQPDAKLPHIDHFWTPDIRGIGLQGGMAWCRAEGNLKQFVKALERATLIKYDDQDVEGLVKTEWLLSIDAQGYDRFRHLVRLWFDTRLRFAPVLSEMHMRMLDAEGNHQEMDPPVWLLSEIEWTEQNSVVVPISVKGSESSQRGLDVKIKWQRVNEEFETNAFERDGLGLPGETWVTDGRVDPPVLVGRLDGRPTRQPSSGSRPPRPLLVPRPTDPWWRWPVIIAAGVVIAVILLILLVRRCARYSLRTLFVVITIVGCVLGYHFNWMWQRDHVMEFLGLPSLTTETDGSPIPPPPWTLRLFGAEPCDGNRFVLGPEITEEEEKKIQSLFPEIPVERELEPAANP